MDIRTLKIREERFGFEEFPNRHLYLVLFPVKPSHSLTLLSKLFNIVPMTKNKKENIKNNSQLKKEIGKRFRQFRKAIGKSQNQLAQILNLHQSNIAHMESGACFPKVGFLVLFKRNNNLDIKWLITGEGSVFLKKGKQHASDYSLECHIPKNDPRYNQYAELIDLMQVPVIEQLILAKLQELKVLAKDDIEEEKKKRRR